MSITPKTVREHLKFHEKRAYLGASLFIIFFGLPLLIIAIRISSKNAAYGVVDSQKSYIAHLLLTNDLVELQRNFNSIASSSAIREISINDNSGKVLSQYSKSGSSFFGNGSDTMVLTPSGGPQYTIEWVYEISWSLLLWISLSICIGVLISAYFIRNELFKISKKFSYPIELLSNTFKDVTSISLQSKSHDDFFKKTEFVEIDNLQNEFLLLLERLDIADKKIIELAKKEALASVAKQVAHDIRSPLSTINMLVPSLSAEPSQEKVDLLMNAADRISAIAEDLLKKGRESQNDQLNISDLVKSIVKEKELQLKNMNSTIRIEVNDKIQGKQIDLRISKTEFERIISNLLTNSIEALKSQQNGLIDLKLASIGHSVELIIKDNGIGIPVDILSKIGTKGFTSGKKDGNGLGVFHAKSTIENVGGSFLITSKLNTGTSVKIVI